MFCNRVSTAEIPLFRPLNTSKKHTMPNTPITELPLFKFRIVGAFSRIDPDSVKRPDS